MLLGLCFSTLRIKAIVKRIEADDSGLKCFSTLRIKAIVKHFVCKVRHT